ncbi:mucin-binding protein [Lactobacillus delbrueckii]|uniref:mucin-binding protein n=1 Tax=Lactobacillus delbrueckii TaxID=1584 RepID=UPI003A854370
MIEVKKFARNKLQKMKRKEQHYSFRKVNTGLASVLLGFTLGGLAITFTPGKVAASDNNSAQVATTQQTSSNSTAEQTNNTSSTAESTQVKTQVSYTGSNQNPATQETKTTFSGKKTGDSSYDWTNKSATVTTTVPVVSGYIANTDQVTQTVSANSDGSFTGSDNITGKSSTVSNDTYTSQVTYKAVGRIVPVDKNGNEITADIKGNYVAPVAYSNSPTRADQVVATAAPTIGGYILADSANETITPASATEDTKVIYLLVTTTKGVKQVVTYTGAGTKTPAENSQTITFSKTTSRSSDGKTTTSDWDKDKATFENVTVPTIEGYTADVTTVTGQTVTADSEDINVPVTYTANDAKATVNFKDDDTRDPQDLSANSISLTGKTDESIDFTTAEDQVKNLLAAGYELSQTNDAVIDPATGKFKVTSYDTSDDASTVSQVFTIHLKHKTTTTTTSKNVTRTIDYQSTDSDFTAPSSQTQTASFTEEKVTDDVTGKTLSDTWTPDGSSWEKVTTPEVAGYVADQASVSEKDVTKDSEDEKATVNYVKIGQITSQKGTSQTALTYKQDATSVSFTVPVEAGYTATLNGKAVSQGSTITLTGADAAVDQNLLYTANAQSATFAFVDDQGQTLYTSNLTGQTDGDVDFTSANKVLAKFIAAGYQVSSNNPNLTESEFTAATYAANGGQSFTAYLVHPEKTVSLTASYQDASGNKLADDQTKSFTFTGLGKYDEDQDVVTVTWTAKDGDAVLANPVITGYVSPAAKVTINSSATGVSSQTVVYQAVGKLNAVDENGKLLASLAYANNPADASQVIVNLPTVADYTATQTSVTVANPTQDTDLLYVPSAQTKVFTQKATFSGAGAKTPAEQSETIIFVKNGDSWKQTSGPANGKFSFTIPDITGYSKSVSREAATVTPDTASVSDITVTYTPLEQKATVTFVDDNESDPTKQTLTTVDLTGQTDAKIDFANAKTQLTSYEAAGYVLAAGSALPTDAVYDDDTEATQAYTVHLKHGTTVLTSSDLSSLSAATKVKISTVDLQTLQSSDSYTENKDASRTVKSVFSSTDSTDLPSVADKTDSVTFSRPITYTVDQVTGAVTKSEGDWTVTTGQAVVSDVTPQTISGWYLAETANGEYLPAETLQAGDSQTVTLTYKRLQKAAIQVIDGDDSGKVLDQYSQSGQKGAAINFKQIDEQTTLTTKDASGNESTVTINSVSDANAQLNAYIKAGYVLDTTDATTSQVDAQTVRYQLADGAIIDVVSDNQGNKTYAWANSFDSDDTADQTIKLKLLHGTTTQTKNKTVTRNITINPVKGNSYTIKQTVNLKETIITDNVTGKTTSDTWTTGTWAAYGVPTETGYDASVTSIPEVTVTNTTPDADIVVNYLPKAASATIKIIDDDAGNAELNEYLVSGTTAGQINFTNAIKQLTSYLDGNYIFASSNNSKIVIAYNKDGDLSSITAEDIYEGSDASQNYEIHLKHKTKTGTIYSSVNRTISYQLPTGTQTLVQKVVLTCSTVTDLVTGSRSDGAWVATGSWSAETVPEVTGYTSSETSIEAESVNVETPDKAITVVYTPDVEHVQVNIIDDTTHKILAEADLTGDYGSSVDFDKPAKSIGNVSPNGKLQSYLANGYDLATDNNSAVDAAASPVVFKAAKYGTQGVTLEAHLVQGIKETTESATSTRTIQYIISGADKPFKTVTQPVTVTRTKTVNQVTGETTYTDWTTGTWDEAVSPTHETDPTDVPDGYYPDKATVAKQTGISKNTGDQVVLVLYNKPGDGISGTVQIVDETTNTNLYSVQINGKSGSDIDFSAPNTRLADYLKQGYLADTTPTLVSQAINEAGTAFAEKQFTTNGQNFIVYLTHGIDKKEPQTKSITRTVNYSFPNGTTKTFVQAVNYTRMVSLDKVTDKTSYGDWTLAKSSTTVSVNGAAATKTEGDVVATWAALDTAKVAGDAGIDTTGYKASLDSVEAVSDIGTDTTSKVINISFPAIVEKARIVFLDSSSSAPTKDANGQTITPEFTYASSYDGHTAGVYKNAIDFSHANLYLKDLLQQGYEIGVDDFVNPNSGSYMAKLTSSNTVTAADGTVTEIRVYTPAATGAETITETITTSPSTTENGQTKQVVKYAFVQGDKSGEITATTTTVDGTSTTVYSLSNDTFAATDKTFLFFLKHGRTHYSYDPDKSNNNASTYKDTTRTIHYHLPDGSTLTRLQTVRMTRTTDIDRVTGGVIYTPWTTGESNYSWIVQSLTDKDGKLLSTSQEATVRSSDWSQQASPDEDNTIVISGKTTVGSVVKGYTATRGSVDAQNVTSSTPNSLVDISYKADPQAADIQIIDDTTNTVLSEFNPSGVTAGKIDFTAANSSLNYYLQHGYLLATGDGIDNSAVATTDGVTSFIDANFDNEDNTDQSFVVHLVHDTATTDKAIDKTVTTIVDKDGNTISYVTPVVDNPKVTDPASYKQTVTSVRTAKYVFSGDSSSKPKVADFVQKVTWTRDVSFNIDLVTGKETPIYSDWTYVASGPNAQVGQDATSTSDDQVTLTPVALTDDEVKQGFIGAVSGEFSGWYLVSSADNTGKQLLKALDNGSGINENVVLEYRRYADATIQIIDDTTGKVLKDDKITGYSQNGKQGTQIDFTQANTDLADYLAHGYALASDGNSQLTGNAFTATAFDNKDNETQTFVAHLIHDTAIVSEKLTSDSQITAKSGRTAYLGNALTNTTLTDAASYSEQATSTRKVTFAFGSNAALPAGVTDVNGTTVTQTVTYTRPIVYTVDLVTGTATRDYEAWNSATTGISGAGTTTTIDENGKVSQSPENSFTDAVFPAVTGTVSGWYLASEDAPRAAAKAPSTDKVAAKNNVETTVTLTFKKLQNAYIKIVDNNDTDNQVTLYDESGSDANSNNVAQKQGVAINFKNAQAKLDELLKSGYVVDAENTKSLTGSTFTAANFDSDDTSDQIITVYLKHASATLQADTANNNVTSDGSTVSMSSQINPDSSTNKLLWSGVKSDADLIDMSSDSSAYQSLTRQAVQTINYLYKDTNLKAYDKNNVSRKALTRTVTVDRVTGKILTISGFTPVTFDNVPSPVVNKFYFVMSKDAVVAGYSVSDTVADGKDSYTASNKDGDSQATLTPVYTVYYETDGKWKKVNEPVYGSDGSLTSNTGTVDVGSYVTSDTDPSVVTITIPAHQGYTAKLDIGNDGTIDTSWDWNDSAEKTPANEVYQFDTSLANKDSTVTYSPDGQTLCYKVLDLDESSKDITDASSSVLNGTTLATGLSDQAISAGKFIGSYTSVAAELDALKVYYQSQGYRIDSVDTTPAAFDHDGTANQFVTIKLTHEKQTFASSEAAANMEKAGQVTDDGQTITYKWTSESSTPKDGKLASAHNYSDSTTATRKVTYQFEVPTGEQLDSQLQGIHDNSIVQTVTYTRAVEWTIDLVTGEITRDHQDWQFEKSSSGNTNTTTTISKTDGTSTVTTSKSSDSTKEEMPAVTGDFDGWYLDSTKKDNVAGTISADNSLLSPDATKEGSAADQNASVTLYYLKKQNAFVKIIDDNAANKQDLQNSKLVSGTGNLYSETIAGKEQGAKLDFTTASAWLKKLLASGYKIEKYTVSKTDGKTTTEISSDNNAADFEAATFDNDGQSDQLFAFYLVHDTVTVDGDIKDTTGPQTKGDKINSSTDSLSDATWPVEATDAYLQRQVGQTIKYVFSDGKHTESDATQSATLTRQVTIDKVTGQAVSDTLTNFTSVNFTDTNDPIVTGYHVVSADQDGTALKDTESIAAFVPVVNNFATTSSDQDKLTTVFTVTYRPNGSLKIVDADNTLPEADKADIPYTTTKADTVTVTVPIIQGYTAVLTDGNTSTTLDASNNTFTYTTYAGDSDRTVTYSAKDQTISYQVYDETDQKYLTVDGDKIFANLATGKTRQTVDLTSAYQAILDKYEKLGYKFVENSGLPTVFDDKDDPSDGVSTQNVVITLAHNTATLTGSVTNLTKVKDDSGKEVDLPDAVKKNTTLTTSESYIHNATVTRTISYVFDSNSTNQSKPQAKSVVQKVNFTQAVNYQTDLVTGQILKTIYQTPSVVSAETSDTNAVSDGSKISYSGSKSSLKDNNLLAASGDFTKAGWYQSSSKNADSVTITAVVDENGKLTDQSQTGDIHYLKYQTAVIKIVDDYPRDKMTLQNGVLTSDSNNQGELFVQNITLADQKKQDDDVDFSSANTLLADLLNSGFKFEKSDVGTASGFNEAQYDSDDDTTQEFTIYLVHDTITLDGQETGANGPQTAGGKINTGKAAIATYPSEATRDYLTKTASQTIKFDVSGGTALADNVQTQTLTRTATFDKVTGKLKSTGDWRIKSFTALKAYPVVPGYHVTGVDAKKTTDQSSQTVDTAGGYTPTETDPTIVYTVHYEPNGSVVGKNEPGDNTTVQYTTNSDAKTVTGQVNLYPGYTATITTKSGTKTFDPVDQKTTEAITPEDAGKDTTVTYTANFQQAVVKLIDDDDNTNTVTFTIDGDTGKAIKFTYANAKLKEMLSQGYILSASGNTDLATDLQSFAEQKFDATNNAQKSDAAIQYFQAHLKHDTAKLTGVPITGSNTNADKLVPSTTPIVDKLKEEASYTDASTVKRTVNYVFAGDSTNKPSIAGVVQTVTYTRPVTYTIDLVTGTILNVGYGDYSFSSNVSTTTKRTAQVDGTIVSEPESLGKDAIVPAVSGDFTAIGWYLDPKSATANATELKQGSKDQEVNLTYLRYQKAIIQIIDEDSKDTNKAIYYDDQANAQKEQGSDVDFKAADAKLQDLLNHGYIFAADKLSDGDQSGFTAAKLDSKDDSDQTFTIYLKHDMAVITSRPTVGVKIIDEDGKQVNYNPKTDNLADKSFKDTSTASRTVSYVFDGDSTDKPQKADLVQKSNFERPVSYKVDLATGEILAGPTYGKWTSKDDEISAAPTDVAGWYLTSSTNAGEMTLVPGQKVDGSLHYSKIQQAVVQIIDDTTNTSLNSKDLTGKQGEVINFSEANGWLKDYLASGYVLVSGKSDVTDDAFTPATFDKLDNSNQSFVAHLIHRIAIVSGVPTTGESDNVHDENNQSVIYTPKKIDTQLQNGSNFGENATATRKVHYVFEGNSTAKPVVDDVTQTVNFNRSKSYKVDMVTGEIKDDPIYGAWTFVSGSTGNTSAETLKENGPVIVNGATNSLTSAEVPAVTGSFAGWYQTSANVAAKTLAAGDDLTIDLDYKHYQNAKIQVIDDDESDPDKKMLFDTTTTGKQDTSVDFKDANTALKSYLASGYVLDNAKSTVTGNVFTPADFDELDDIDQSFVAHLIHQKVTVNSLPEAGKSFKDVNGTDYDYPTTTAVKIPDVFTNEVTVKRTISHKFETTNPNEQVPVASDIVQAVLYQRGITYTIDLVTGEYTTNLGAWTIKENTTETGGVPDEQVPVVSAGNFDGWYRYEADDQNIDQTSLLLDNQGQAIDQTGVLTYKKYQKAIVQIIDQTKNKLLFVDAKSNDAKKQGADVDFTLANQELASLLKAGYALVDGQTIVSGTTFVPAKMDSDDTVDEVFTVYLQHTYTKSSEDIQITRIINYHKPDSKVDTITQPVKLSRKVTTDNVDQTKDYGSWTTGNWDEKITPAIAGYKAVQPKVDKVAVTVNTPDQTVDVYYVADTQQVKVKIIDDKTGNTLFTTSLSGKTDQAVDFASVNNELAGKLASGYALAKDKNQDLENSEFKATNYLPDDKRTFEAHLVHTYSEETESKTITRMINYKQPDGGIETVKQLVELTRLETTDNVDQTKTFGKWTSGQWDEAISPLVPGYKASQSSVGQVAVDEYSQDQTIDITYSANGQIAKVKIFDDKTGTKIREMALDGKSDQIIDFKSANDQLQAYLNQGYAFAQLGNGDLANGSFIPVKFDNDDAATQEFVAHLVHTYAKSTEDKTATRTINYQQPDGSVVTVTQPVKLTRDVTTDKVTKVPSYGEWTNGQWDEKDTPVITGYTPSESSVGQVLVNGDSQDTTINISYTANDQKAVVKIFDKKIGKDIYLENLLGTTDGKISFKNADDQLAVFLTKGYALADGNSDLTDGQFTPSKFDNVDNVDQVFTAILVHTYSKDSEKKTVTWTINYHKPDGKIDTVTQPVELTRDVTIDKVNQSKTFGDWTSSQWGEKTTPKIAGYTASLDSVGQVTVDGLTKDQVVDIGYKANDQKAVVKIYDDKTKQLLKQFDLSGATAEAINFAEADQQLAGYLAKGYALADSGNDDLAGGKFIAADYDNVDAVDQEFAAYLVHTYAKSNETKTITRTINYHLPSGTEAVEQTAELTRPVTTDLVTGATSYGDWTRSEFTSQKTPELSNYTPSTSLITNREVTHGDADSQENVYYYPNKQKATISFVDSKTGKTIKLMADFDSGKPNEAINFTQAKAQLATLLKEGYKETGDLESIWKAVFAGTDGENNFVIRLVPSLDMHPSVAPGKQSTKPKTTKKGKEAGQKPSVPATGQAGQKPGLTGQTAGKGQQAASPAGQTAKTQSAKLPQTGEASGKQLSWLGLLLAAVGTALSGIWRKKRDDE